MEYSKIVNHFYNYSLLFGFALPKEIQFLIYEFNADHRPQYNLVLEEIKNGNKVENYWCSECCKHIFGRTIYSELYDVFICSKECKKKYIADLPLHIQMRYSGWNE
jgi:hypothetical protein